MTTRVERVRLRIGPLSGVEPPLLETAYPLAAAGTIAEGAALEVAVDGRCGEEGGVEEACQEDGRNDQVSAVVIGVERPYSCNNDICHPDTCNLSLTRTFLTPYNALRYTMRLET